MREGQWLLVVGNNWISPRGPPPSSFCFFQNILEYCVTLWACAINYCFFSSTAAINIANLNSDTKIAIYRFQRWTNWKKVADFKKIKDKESICPPKCDRIYRYVRPQMWWPHQKSGRPLEAVKLYQSPARCRQWPQCS